jgi:hypothetical protein
VGVVLGEVKVEVTQVEVMGTVSRNVMMGLMKKPRRR